VSTTAEEKTTKKATTTKKETTTKETTTEESTSKETTTKKETTTIASYYIYVDIDGNGSVSGDGKYEAGKKATLTAAADPGFEFEGWFDASGNLVASATRYTITVKGDVNLTARFKATEAELQ